MTLGLIALFWPLIQNRADPAASASAGCARPEQGACGTALRDPVARAAAPGILYTSHEYPKTVASVASAHGPAAQPPRRPAHRSPPSRRSIRSTSRRASSTRPMRRLKNAIVAMDIYRSRDDIRLDERKLAQDFGISRTPVREAMAQLEREGFVRSVPRRGIYVVRKTKREVIEMITAWAALESMAARLITAKRQRRGDRGAAPHVRDLRERQAARASRRIFRRQHRVPPDHHPHERATAC